MTDPASLAKAIGELEKQMKAAAKRPESEEAATLRDRIKELRAQQIHKSEGTGDEEPRATNVGSRIGARALP